MLDNRETHIHVHIHQGVSPEVAGAAIAGQIIDFLASHAKPGKTKTKGKG